MGVIVMRCPVTGRDFSTGILIDRDEIRGFRKRKQTPNAPIAGWRTPWTRDGRLPKRFLPRIG